MRGTERKRFLAELRISTFRGVNLARGSTLTILETLRSNRVLVASAALFVSSLMLLSFAILNPATSPMTTAADIDGDGVPDDIDAFPSDPNEFRDSDGDGVGDVADLFPYDSSETEDSDMDGTGDNADFFDEGNGGVKISIDRFEFEGYDSSYHRIKYCPDALFRIFVDSDGDGEYEHVFESDIYYCVERLECFFDAVVDMNETASFIRFSIIAFDVWDTDNNEVLDYEVLDYMPQDGQKTDEQTLELPCTCSWTYCGEGDYDTPDCSLEYSVSTLAV